ncbi:phage tail protein [Massilia consociata]|uniref:Phage tail protein n=1 Tax=Massilia consociata TaxID=760117 RepID=A0ABV6FFB0_9BURK
MDSYIGEVRIFCGTYPPNGWADCNGQELPLAQYQALYAVIGNMYGGTQDRTFALPNLNGLVPLHQGAGPGLTPRAIAQTGGAAAVALTTSQMPFHGHVPQALDNQGTQTDPSGAVWAKPPKAGRPARDMPEFDATLNTSMNALALGPAGASQPHNNLQPYVPVRYIICLDGEFPVRP